MTQQIRQAYNDIDNVVNNLPSVYRGRPIAPQVKRTENQQRLTINSYQQLKDTSRIDRLYDLKKLLDLSKSVDKINDGILDETIKVYDEDAIENVKTLNEINHEIMTKGQVISLNDVIFHKRNRIISIMKSIILYLFLMILPVLLMSLGNISLQFGFIFIGICGIITAIVIIVRYIKDKKKFEQRFPSEPRDEILDAVKETSNFLELDKPKCISRRNLPSSIRNNGLRLNNGDSQDPNRRRPPVNTSTNTAEYRENANEVYLDNSINVWKQGDVPEIGATLTGYNNLNTKKDKATPEPYYSGQTNPKIYKCVWNGDPSKLTSMNRGAKFSTTIPCEFYPGFKSE